MELKDIGVGNNLSLEILSDEEEVGLHLKTRIMDVEGDKVYILPPIRRPDQKPIIIGTKLGLTDDNLAGLKRFDTEVIGHKLVNNSQFYFEVSNVKSINMNRRQHYRAPFNSTLVYSPNKPFNHRDPGNLVASVVDISVAGLGFRDKEDHELGSEFQASLNIEGETTPVIITILNKKEDEDGYYVYGTRVVGFCERTISKLIARLQIEELAERRRKKELELLQSYAGVGEYKG